MVVQTGIAGGSAAMCEEEEQQKTARGRAKTVVKRKVCGERDLLRKAGDAGERTKGGARERETGSWYARTGRRYVMTCSTMLAAFV
jgi:hypothetical protein